MFKTSSRLSYHMECPSNLSIKLKDIGAKVMYKCIHQKAT